VVVADEVALALGAPLEVTVVRKVGAPMQPELGVGAVGSGGVRVLNQRLLQRLALDDDEVEQLVESELAEVQRRTAAFRADRGPVAIWQREVAPGVYFLRQSLQNGRQFEGTLVAVPGRVTQVVIQRSSPAPADGQVGAIPVDEPAVFMRAAADGQSLPEQDAVVEAARLALAQGRNLFAEGRGTQLAELLLVKFADPIAGIIGGHLLLRAVDDAQPDPVRTEQFDSAVRHLRALVGPGHPDVEALSLRCADVSLRTTRPFTAPPILRQSWQLICEASHQRPELVPIELWQRVHATVALDAFFV
jgi:hypothetical protein